jgi:predicted PurR-regulated permease PerM
MSKEHLHPHAGGFLITAAAFVIVVAGMQEAREILVPFLLSGFIAIIAAPALFFLTERRIPTALALLLVIGVIVAVGILLGILVGESVDDFSAQLPVYQERLNTQTGALLKWLSEYGISISEQAASKLVDPGKAMKMAAAGLNTLGSLLTNTFLILLTVIFILLEASSFPVKLKQVMADPDQGLRSLNHFLENIKRYMAIKTLTSLATGILIAIWLWIVDVDYPLLWGVLAFLLNFVPNIGSLLAAIPALLLALIQLGISGTLWALLGYVVINNVIGAVIEPRFMGRGLGLSTLVVFLSLVFWGWVLGPVGMFLSVPLTMMVKIGLDSNEQTRWIAVLLGTEKNGVSDQAASGQNTA